MSSLSPEKALIFRITHIVNVPWILANGLHCRRDRHASLLNATFLGELGAVHQLDWKIWQARDFQRNPNDPDKFDRYNAEALAHQHVPVAALQGVVCHGGEQETTHDLSGAVSSLSGPVPSNGRYRSLNIVMSFPARATTRGLSAAPNTGERCPDSNPTEEADDGLRRVLL